MVVEEEEVLPDVFAEAFAAEDLYELEAAASRRDFCVTPVIFAMDFSCSPVNPFSPRSALLTSATVRPSFAFLPAVPE